MLTFTPLCPGFGLECRDFDLARDPSPETLAEIEQAFYQGQVLVLRGQSLTPARFVAFAQAFGPAQPHVIDQFHHPEDPNILILSNVRDANSQPTGLQDAGSYFHTDYSYLHMPARATTLYSIQVPKVGGNTLFANQQAAYEDLPRRMKQRIDALVAVHHYGNRQDMNDASRTAASPLSAAQKAKMPLITHRIARPHPVTGRMSLYAVSGSSFGIVGMPADESRDLLDELAAHATQPKYVYSLAYGVGDVVIWDNASLLHAATLTDPADARTLWRVTVLETNPQALASQPMAAAHEESTV